MKIRIKIQLYLSLFAPISCFAADINQIDANTQQQIRQQERERILRQQQEIKPDVREAGDQLKESVPLPAT